MLRPVWSCVVARAPAQEPGHSTVAARLAEPIGERTIWAGGRQQIPFDGARLLVPSSMPEGYTGLSEWGLSVEPVSTPAEVQVTTTWVTIGFAVRPTPSSDGCAPSSSSLEVRLGPVTTNLARGRTKIGSVNVGPAQANVYRTGSSRKPIGWAYVWTVDDSSVEVATSIDCAGDRLLSRTELLQIAESLRPA